MIIIRLKRCIINRFYFRYQISQMKKSILSLFILVGISQYLSSQTTVTTDPLQVVFQLTSSDTTVFKGLIKQLNNFLNAAPSSNIEVVCHNNGINFLISETTTQAEAIKSLNKKGVDFVACNNTLTDRKIPKEKLLPMSRIVPAGVVEIVLKQKLSWAYIKAG